MGQYLRPTPQHLPVVAYIHPDQFKQYADVAYSKGFEYVSIRRRLSASSNITPRITILEVQPSRSDERHLRKSGKCRGADPGLSRGKSYF